MTNELIKQCANQARDYADGYDDRHEPIWWQFYNERFAEFIIRECAEVASDYDGSYLVGTFVKKHFGIEE